VHVELRLGVTVVTISPKGRAAAGVFLSQTYRRRELSQSGIVIRLGDASI